MKFDVKKPIPGFENIAKVKLVIKDDNFAFLEDEKGNVLFILVNPFYINKNFSFEVPADVKALLELKEGSNLYVYTNVIKTSPYEESLINFKAPFVFNLDNKTCSQFVLENEFVYPAKSFTQKAS